MKKNRKRRTPAKEPERLRVAVCIDTRDGPGRERLLGVYGYALKAGWDLLLVRGDGPDAVQQLTEMRVNGAILFDRPKSFHRAVRQQGILCVETSARNLELDDAAVFVDDAAVGEAALQHLAAAGFEHFGYCGPSETNAPAAKRSASFREHAERLGRPVHVFEDAWEAGEPMLTMLTKWLRRLPKPCGILAFDDKVAERLIAACRWARLPVPQDVAITGVGNDELICELVEPQLTSVGIPLRQIGWTAAQVLDALAQGRPVESRQAIPPSGVVVRASTDRLPRCHPSVAAAMELIRASAHTPIGTDQIAAQLRVPRRTLERRFVAALGRTIHDAVVEMRVRQAKRLLTRSGDSIGEIARRCGYSASSAFTRMFELRVGCRPEDFRTAVFQLR